MITISFSSSVVNKSSYLSYLGDLVLLEEVVFGLDNMFSYRELRGRAEIPGTEVIESFIRFLEVGVNSSSTNEPMA